MVIYQTVEETCWNPSVGMYRAFGICAYCEEKGEKQIIAHIKDVFFDQTTAQRLVDICNRLKLDVVHLYDVVEDALQQEG